jgi:hypothetical protein
MSGREPLAAYVRELAGLLPGPRRRRQRILAEVEHHLHAHVDALLAAGRPEREALDAAAASFGEPALVAAAFTENTARRTLAGASVGVAVTVAGFTAGVAVLTQLPGAGAASPIDDGPAGAAGVFAAQLAIVAAAVGLLRGIALRSRVRVDAASLAMAVRANTLAAGTTAVALGLDGAALARHGSQGSAGTASAIAVGVLAAIALWTLAGLARAGAQVRRLSALEPPARPAASALEQLALVSERLPDPLARSAAAGLQWAAGRRPACIALAAAVPSSALAAASLREHGIPHGARALGAELLAAAVVFGIELAAVMVCAYGFDRLLGLWPEQRRS